VNINEHETTLINWRYLLTNYKGSFTKKKLQNSLKIPYLTEAN